MGPTSKEAVCKALGHLIDEAQLQRELVMRELSAIKHLLQVRGEEESDAQIRIERRVVVLERRLGIHGAPSPAE